MRIESRAGFESLQAESRTRHTDAKAEIHVCCGTGCLANGSKAVVEAFAAEAEKRNENGGAKLVVKPTGCHGFCEHGPLVAFKPSGLLYTKVKAKGVSEVVEKTVEGGEIITRLLYKDPTGKNRVERYTDIPLKKHQNSAEVRQAGPKDKSRIEQYQDIPFYKHQTRVAMRNIGLIDPTDILDAVAEGAYTGLAKALFDMGPDQVIDEVEVSGLRGRGGAGFNTARKWRSCKKAPGDRRFVLCNGDEGDPGAFKDRSIMEGDPHSVIEGMIIGAYALGAHEGFIYVRDEYPLAIVNLMIALEQARTFGLLGSNILGTDFDFDITIARGGGAFVCGESSALMLSIAGKVGEPRAKYVHSTAKGLFDLPTVLNNVESWANIGAIIDKGGEWYASMGTEKSKGTKAFSLVGKVKNTGLIELEMGTTLRHIIFEIGGGILADRPFKAVQTGGPSGGCVPESLLDLPVDFERLTEAGSMMGSGGMIVMDDRTCMVDVARYFLAFLIEESCGKCTPCREGLRQMLVIYDGLVEGHGKPGDIERIERLAQGMQLGSLCELGKSAPNPVLSTLRYFRDEYDAHINDKACPAGMCRELTAYRILEDLCGGCHACFKACPVDAITGESKALHTIHHDACISCGACFDVCPDQAIETFPKNTLFETEVV